MRLFAITFQSGTRCYSCPSFQNNEEDHVRKRIILAIGGLLLLAGCGEQGNKGAGIPVQPKWKGLPYRLAFETKAAKPNPAGITIPAVKFTANPESLETRALLVMRFSASAGPDKDPVEHRMIGGPVDIHGEEGTLPADYMDRASKGLADYLGAYCIKGKVDLSVALGRSSLNPQAGDPEMNAKRLSDWLPIELQFKNPRPKCK
jgi:hypothetical protein